MNFIFQEHPGTNYVGKGKIFLEYEVVLKDKRDQVEN